MEEIKYGRARALYIALGEELLYLYPTILKSTDNGSWHGAISLQTDQAAMKLHFSAAEALDIASEIDVIS